MKKNFTTILLLAMAFVNLTLSAVLIFAVVPTATKTNKLVTKVMQILDLELESEEPEVELGLEDIEAYKFEEKVTANLTNAVGEGGRHYAVFPVLLSLNKTNADYTEKKELIAPNQTVIIEVISEEFGKYTVNTVLDNKETIKTAIIARLADYFDSDFIVNISFGDIVVS